MANDEAGNTDAHPAVNALIADIRRTEDPPDRNRLISQLAKMGIIALPHVVDLLHHDVDARMRFDAALTLARMDDVGLNALLDALDSDDANVRAAVTSVLEEAVAASEKLHASVVEKLSDSDPRIRRDALNWIKRNQLSEAAPAVLTLLDDDDVNVKLAAIEVAGDLCLQEAAPILVQFLAHPEEDVRVSAAQAIASFPTADSVDAMIAAFQHSDDWRLREELARALGASKTPEAFQFLLTVLQEESSENVLQATLNAIAWLHDAAAVPYIVPYLEARHGTIMRQRALWSLAEIGDPGSLKHAIQHLADEDPHIRFQAVSLLGAIGNDAAVAALIASLRDTSPVVVRAAIFKLADVGTRRAIEPLQALIRGGDDQLDELVHYALSKLEDSSS